MAVTAKKIAKELGLSEAAVSMALNNKPGVSTATRKRVLDEAKKQGYDFSRKALADVLHRGRFCFVIYKKSGAVVGDTPFFSDVTDGISIACRKERCDLVIRYIYEDESLSEQLYTLAASNFDGIILLATEMDVSSLSHFSGIKTPILILDAYFEELNYNCVLINNGQGAYLATSYLISKRRTQPGYLRSSYHIGNFDERADGFFKALRANGMSAGMSVVHRLTPSQEGAYADMRELLKNGEKPADCYFADNDYIAIGAITALKEAGYRVPEDVAVVGFDDISMCEYMDPPLTTIHVPKQIMGETAVNRLIAMVEQKSSHALKIEVGTMLVKRASV